MNTENQGGFDRCMMMVKQPLPAAAFDTFAIDVLTQLGVEVRGDDQVRVVSHGCKGTDGLVLHPGRLYFDGEPGEVAAWLEQSYPLGRRPEWVEALRAHCAELGVKGCTGFEVSTAEVGVGIAEILRGVLSLARHPDRCHGAHVPESLDILYVGIADNDGYAAAEMAAERVCGDGDIVRTNDQIGLTAQQASRQLVSAYDDGEEGRVDWEDVDLAYETSAKAVMAEKSLGRR